MVKLRVTKRERERERVSDNNYEMFQELGTTQDTDAAFALLTSMKYLILNGECLNYTVTQFPDYVKFSLSKFLIPK